MEYPIFENNKINILDDTLSADAINKIRNIIGRNFELEINSDYELLNLLNNPELFIEDLDIIYKIKEINYLISIIESIYKY